MNEIEIKRKLLSLCEQYVDEKIEAAQTAINSAQKSANEETKSSVGDKYETGRSMLQLEIEKYSSQLNEGYKLKKALSQINVEKIYDSVQTGSIVKTNLGNFFISISAGKIKLEDIEYIVVSFSSPIGQNLYNKRADESVVFKDKEYKIIAIS